MQAREDVIAIDGPAGSGKSTAARLVARRLGATMLDTGAIYRTVALLAREADISWDDGPALATLATDMPLRFAVVEGQNRVFVGPRDVSAAIRTPDVSRGASRVSAHPELRSALLQVQRGFARRGTVVAEGRDIGTVVFPAARLKVFLDADPTERARRRHAELLAAGGQLTLDQVLAEQQARDRADQGREVAPLRAADDAVRLDTSGLSVEQVVGRIVALAREGGLE